jgi:hypothetical protein
VRLSATLFAIGLAVYSVVAWDRLRHPSPAPHFVYQADAWLHGHLAIAPPLAGDDWARIETVALDDGSQVRGRRLITRPAFRTLDGDELPIARVRQSFGKTAYMSFPPFPTVLMLPSALAGGRAGNDVIPTLLVAALILPLMLQVLRRLATAGLSHRSPRDDLWLSGTPRTSSASSSPWSTPGRRSKPAARSSPAQPSVRPPSPAPRWHSW